MDVPPLWIGFGSALLLAFGIFSWEKARALLAQGVQTRATVVDYQEERSRSSHETSYTYAPIIEFTTRKGTYQRVVLKWSSNPPMYRKGTTIAIRYDPESPTTVDIDSVWTLVVLPRVCTVLGGIGLLYSAIQWTTHYLTQ